MSSINFNKGYSLVNGLEMYYEIYGQGKPLVLIHGGGSTIETTFGRIIPHLAPHRQLIGVELQAHGHTGDRDTPLSFQQDADDIAALLHNLQITSADFFGFSNGGQTAIELALRHPQLVNKLILASTFYNREAAVPQFWEGFNHAHLGMMPEILKEYYLKANNDEAGLLKMFSRDVERMLHFKGWTTEQVKQIQAPTLVINGTHDVGSCEHAVEMFRTIPVCELAIFPGGHGEYMGTLETIGDGDMPAFNAVKLIETFLDKA